MYAGDIKIYGVYNCSNKAQVCQALSQSVSIMMEWADALQIPVNISKISVLHIGAPDNVENSLNDCVLSSVSGVRDLRVFIDHILNFGNHIDTIVRKAFSTAFLIFRNIKNTQSSILISLYKTYAVYWNIAVRFGAHLQKSNPSFKRCKKPLQKICFIDVYHPHRTLEQSLVVRND